MAAFSPATPAPRAPVIERSRGTIADEQPPSAVSAEVQSAAKHRVSARNAVPKAIDGYTRPNENGPAADAPAAIAAQNAPAASSGAKAIAARTARINSTDSAIFAAPPPAAPSMLKAGRPTGSPTALRRAAEIGDIPGLQTSLDEHVDINARDASGRTALMLATLRGQTAAVDTLLAYGADPNAADARGTTPLQAAVAADQRAIVAALKHAGAR
jgi:ankyrin repeat protein